MDDWRQRLRDVASGWGLSPEDEAAVAEELETHLEQQLAELTPRIGVAAAYERIITQVEDPAFLHAAVPSRHRPAPSVEAARRGGAGWDGLARDAVYACRTLGRNVGTTVVATVALALGIGLTTVMFSIIYGTLIRGLPFDEGSRIGVVMRSAAIDGRDENLPMHEFLALRDAQHSFEDFGAYLPSNVNLSGDDRPERVTASRITAGAMRIPRVRPILGRLLLRQDEDPASELVVVLSYRVWHDRYASDSNVVGRSLRVNGLPARIVGVTPEGFDFPLASAVWIPLRLNAAAPWGTGPSVNGIGRLRAGVSFERANAELAGIAARIDAEHPRANYATTAVAQPFVRAVVRSQVYTLLSAMFVAVGLVFLVACFNVANLLLARTAARAKEIALRRVLGASATRIARQLFVEALLLSLLGAAFGALLADAGVGVFRHIISGEFPFFADIRLYPQVLVFVVLSAIVASLVSVLPALSATRSSGAEILKDQSLGSSSLRFGKLSRSLVVFEVALSSALLIVAALTTKSLINLRSVAPRFRSEGVLTARVTLTSRDSTKNALFFERLDQELSRLPGVGAATLTTGLPGTGWGQRPAMVEGRDTARRASAPMVRHLAVTPGFFTTFGVTVTRGRGITSGDRRGSLAVAVVNQRFVNDYLAGRDPIGRRINLGDADTGPRWATVVGVIPDLYAVSMRNPWPAEVLTPFAQEGAASANIALYTERDPAALAQPLRSLVASMDHDLPVYAITPMPDVMTAAVWPSRVFGGLFAVFGAVALLLASIGLYAVLAFSVRQRERELGIRMALGAAGTDVMRLVFRDGALQLGVGAVVGLLLGLAAARAARSMLFGVQPADPTAIGVAVATLIATGIVASVAPALRAARADPLRSLRAE